MRKVRNSGYLWEKLTGRGGKEPSETQHLDLGGGYICENSLMYIYDSCIFIYIFYTIYIIYTHALKSSALRDVHTHVCVINLNTKVKNLFQCLLYAGSRSRHSGYICL